MGAAEFEVVSKLPALPVDAGLQDCVDIALAAVERSRRRLGPRLKALMFHRAEDLLSGHGPGLWAALAPLCGDAGIAVGVSCYDPATLANVASRFDVEVAQLPGNALDQAVVSAALPDRIRIHVRSLFLQGLLLMPLAQARQRVPAAAEALRRWHDWCEDRSLAPLQAALGVVKDWPGVELCVVGVESVAQLEQIAEAWDAAEPLSPPGLAQSEADVTDPSPLAATGACVRTVAIIQARTSSTRLPGKVLRPLGGKPMIAFMLARVAPRRRVDEVIVATSDDPSDDPLAASVVAEGHACHRGSLDDVLGRFHGAAVAHAADVVVRLTGDCPLMDADLVDTVVDRLHSAKGWPMPRTWHRRPSRMGWMSRHSRSSPWRVAWRQAAADVGSRARHALHPQPPGAVSLPSMSSPSPTCPTCAGPSTTTTTSGSSAALLAASRRDRRHGT